MSSDGLVIYVNHEGNHDDAMTVQQKKNEMVQTRVRWKSTNGPLLCNAPMAAHNCRYALVRTPAQYCGDEVLFKLHQATPVA